MRFPVESKCVHALARVIPLDTLAFSHVAFIDGNQLHRSTKKKINIITRHQKLTNSSFLSYIVKIVLPRAISCSQCAFLLLPDTRTTAGIQREIYYSDNFHTSYEISVIPPSVLQIFFKFFSSRYVINETRSMVIIRV